MKKRSLIAIVSMLVVAFTLISCTVAGNATEAASVKTGLGIVAGFTSSKEATQDADGTAQIDATFVAVTVDAEGKIVKAAIDVYQAKVKFDATGKITSDLTAKTLTKRQLLEGYNMKPASPIGKEWYEQAAAFEAYVVGKTLAEIEAIEVDEGNHPVAEDIRAGTTMSIGDFKAALKLAVESAQDLGAKATDKLGLATEIDLAERSKDATADADGVAYAYSYYAAVTVGEDGKITSDVLNASQFQVKFTAEGKYSTDLTAPQFDKLTLKDGYNMRGASPIGKEWFEQADFFSKYVIGKTVEEISAIEVDEGNHPVAEDIRAGTTVSIGSFQATLAEAAADAK
ncbi:MAG: hypothetical protein LBD16_03380 [Oscillospiraceae bacterium]|jgi:hypothetical protein|nr:hypothetical protein [Oscillospiraceae bacterium]